MAFLGILSLAVPTLSLNARKKRLQQVKDISEAKVREGSEDAFLEIVKEVRQVREDAAGRWRPIDEYCLIIGYFLLLGSAFLRVFS